LRPHNTTGRLSKSRRWNS